jgi:hypothetical protein
MSVGWIKLIPCDARFLPDTDDAEAAIEAFRNLAPDANEITVFRSEKVEFFDCGENFVDLSCPSCGTRIQNEWWWEAMSQDHTPETGFNLAEYDLPCCSTRSSVNGLVYNMPQAFGRFALCGKDCNIVSLTDAQVQDLGRILKCELRVVYQHL